MYRSITLHHLGQLQDRVKIRVLYIFWQLEIPHSPPLVCRWCCAIFKPPFLTRRTMGISFRLLQETSPFLLLLYLANLYNITAIIILLFFTTTSFFFLSWHVAKPNLAWTLGSQRRIADTLSRGLVPYQVTIVAATENHGQKRQHTQEKSRRHRWISTEF